MAGAARLGDRGTWAALRQRIIEIFDDSDGTYGYRRVHAQLEREGIAAGPEPVRSIMVAAGLVACGPRPYRVTTLGGR